MVYWIVSIVCIVFLCCLEVLRRVFKWVYHMKDFSDE